MSEKKLYTLEEIDQLPPDPETANAYDEKEVENIDSWGGAKNILIEASTNFAKGFGSDIARIPDQIGWLIKETGEKGGAGIAIPSFNDGVNYLRTLTGKEIEKGKVDELLIQAGEKLSEMDKVWMDRLNLKPDEGSPLAEHAFNLGQGAASLMTSAGLMLTLRNPALIYGLYGARAKAETYQEAREAGKDPVFSTILSNMRFVIEGGVEALGGMAFLKGISFNKFLTRSLFQIGTEGAEEGLQQSGEEFLTQMTGVRKDSMNNTLMRIGYSALLGVVLGSPLSLIHSGQQKMGLQKELTDLGFSKKQAKKIMERVSEKTLENGSLKQELVKFLEEEAKITEKLVNENPDFKPIDIKVEEETKGKERFEGYKKAFHQTSEEAAQKIEKEGFVLGKGGSGDTDVLPFGINTKSTEKELPLRGRGKQIEIYYPSDLNIKEFESRNDAELYVGRRSDEYINLSNKIDKIDSEISKEVDRLLDSDKPGDLEKADKILEDARKKMIEWATEAKKIAKDVFEKEGFDAIRIEKDVGAWATTDNLIIFNPKKIKTRQQLGEVSAVKEGEKQYGEGGAVSDIQLDFYDSLPKTEQGVNIKQEIKQAYGSKEEYDKAIREMLESLRRGESKVPPGKVLRQVAKLLREKGFAPAIGFQIFDVQDLAEVAAVFRNPNVELFQAIYTKEGRIVAHEAITCNIPAEAFLPDSIKKQISEKVEKLGVDKIYFSHNHPSGNSQPSVDFDIPFNAGLIKLFGDKFGGHAVLNGDDFAFIDENNNVTYHQYKTPKISFRLETDKPRSPEDVIKEAKKNFKDGKITVIYANRANKTLAIEYYGKDKNLIEAITQKMRAYSSSSIFIVYSTDSQEEFEDFAFRKFQYPEGVIDIIGYNPKTGNFSSFREQNYGNFELKRYNAINPHYKNKMKGVLYRKLTEEQISGSITRVAEEDTSFDYGANVEENIEKKLSAFEQMEEEAAKAELEAEFIKDRLEFRKQVGKFRRYRKGFLKEELGSIPSSYFTKNPNAPFLDELAQELGFESEEDLRNAIIAFEEYRPGAEAKLEGLKEFLKEFNRIVARNKKIIGKYVRNIGEFLSRKYPTKKVIREKTGQVDLSKKVTEMQALKANLHAQARAALQAEKATKADLKNLKQGIVDTIKAVVPVSGQAKFLNMVATAESGIDILKAMTRVEKVVDDITRKQLVRSIKQQVKRISASKQIAVDYIQKIQDYLNNFDLQKRTSGTILSLLETQRYLDEQRAAGADVSIPQYILNKLQILERQPLENIDTATLQNILNDIAMLAEMGKTKLRSLQALQAEKKLAAVEALRSGTKKMESRQTLRPKIGEKLTFDEKRKNFIAKIVNKMQMLDLVITPMDAVFDLLDGTKGYTGPNFRIFKKTIDQANSANLNKKLDWGDPAIKLANELNLNDENFERIGVYAAKVQEGGLEKLEAMGYSQQEIDSIKLNEAEKKWYDLTRDTLDNKIRPEVAETMRVVYNENLKVVKNYYPYMTDFESMSDFEINQRFGKNAQMFSAKGQKNVEMGFTKERVGGKQKIKLHAMEIFLRHVDNAAYLVTVGQETKWLGEIASSEEYREIAGDVGQEMVVDWIDTVARKGRMAGERHNIWDTIRKNVGIAVLGLKLSSTLIQPTALMDGAALIGPSVFEGAKLVGTDPNWRKFVMDNMPEVRARIGDDPSYQDFGGKTIIDKSGQVAFWALQRLDALTASSVGIGAYLKYMRDNKLEIDLANPNADAIDYAQRMVRRTQASAFFKDAPQAVTRGKLTGNRSLDRLILQFQTFMLGRWSMIKHDGYKLGFKSGNMAQGLNVLTWMILATGAENGVRWLTKELIDLLVPGDDDKKKKDDGITLAIVKGVLDKIPFASQALSMVMYGSVPVPAISYMANAANLLGAVWKSKQPVTIAKNAARAFALLSGLFGVPGAAQADQILRSIKTTKKKKSHRL